MDEWKMWRCSQDHISQSRDQYWLCHLSRLARLNEFPASNLSPKLIKFWALWRHECQHKAFVSGSIASQNVYILTQLSVLRSLTLTSRGSKSNPAAPAVRLFWCRAKTAYTHNTRSLFCRRHPSAPFGAWTLPVQTNALWKQLMCLVISHLLLGRVQSANQLRGNIIKTLPLESQRTQCIYARAQISKSAAASTLIVIT